MLRNVLFPGLFLAAALSFAAAPGNEVAASECGGPGGPLCKENESCLNIIFYKHCTTTYDYWNGF